MLFLALLSAVLFSVPYFRWGTGIFLFVAFVPLLFIEDEFTRRRLEGDRRGSVTWYVVLAMALWVLLTTFWVYFATWVGIVASVIVNTMYMALTFWLFHFTRRRLGDRLGYASLVFYWLTFEFLYTRAQVNFPWLLLGNGFAKDIILIQWYEVTGVLGGSLWVLVTNLAVFRLIRGWGRDFRIPDRNLLMASRRRISAVLALLLIPFVISLVRFLTYEEKQDPYEMVVVQPNIDPWMKFNDMSQEEQTNAFLEVAGSLVTPRTEYIVGPETFINNGVWQSEMENNPEIRRMRAFLAGYPQAKMVLGATTYKLYTDPSEFTSSSRELRNGMRYDSYNSAFQLDESGRIPIYNKSLLVAGVETMPHAQLLGFLEDLTVQLGGTFRSHGTQEFRETFASPQDSTRVAPVICWESVFGEYVTEYVREAGAHFLFIITNDGWWRKTPGHRQHNAYARLRAIETRRSIARSANTGISSLINQRGQELDRIGWWERAGLRGDLNKNDRLTFYVRYGDFLGRISGFVAAIFLLYSLVARYTRKPLG